MPLSYGGLGLILQTLFVALGTATVQPRPSTSCKAVPGTPGWPSLNEWKRFNTTLGGRLLQPNPPAAVCHRAGFNSPQCAAVIQGWPTFEFHQADPVSVDWNNWTNDTCLPIEGAPCTGQGYPVYVINATEPRHVQLGVQFAANHNIRLVIKSSGHDFLGRSVAPNSLSIWTHHLRSVQTHTSFRPQGCRTGGGGQVISRITAVTVGAGTPMYDVYRALDALNLTTVGGGAKSVSLGGFMTGAGHGLLSPTHGLSADQVLEVELVTAKGEIVTANACQNRDLFWAVRGGGGSTFGVLTSITVRTFPSPKLDYVSVVILTQDLSDKRRIFDMAAYVLSKYPSLSDSGVSGYSFILGGGELPGGMGDIKGPLGGLFFGGAMLDSTPEKLRALWEPILNHVQQTWPGVFFVDYQTESFPTFLAWFERHYDVTPAGGNLWMGSRLLDKNALTRNVTALSFALERFAGDDMAIAHLVSGKGVHDSPAENISGLGNAVLPAWRKAYVHAIAGASYPPLNATALKEAKEKVKYRTQAMRELAPGMGSYINEANPEEPNWQHEFWGVNYPRLLSIKRAVDPNDVFWCTPCVGNDRWKQVGDRLCRVGRS